MRSRTALLLALIATALLGVGITACGSESTAESPSESATSDDAAGVRVVSVEEAAAIVEDPPADLTILDVRTPEEFDAGHIEGAVMLDFYREDFADELADLDPDVPYVLYCRSGNRSGQARALMETLGFADVADIDGGIEAWSAAGMPIVGA